MADLKKCEDKKISTFLNFCICQSSSFLSNAPNSYFPNFFKARNSLSWCIVVNKKLLFCVTNSCKKLHFRCCAISRKNKMNLCIRGTFMSDNADIFLIKHPVKYEPERNEETIRNRYILFSRGGQERDEG